MTHSFPRRVRSRRAREGPLAKRVSSSRHKNNEERKSVGGRSSKVCRRLLREGSATRKSTHSMKKNRDKFKSERSEPVGTVNYQARGRARTVGSVDTTEEGLGGERRGGNPACPVSQKGRRKQGKKTKFPCWGKKASRGGLGKKTV